MAPFDVAALLRGYNDSTAALLRSAGLTGGAVAPDEPATQVAAQHASTGASEDSPLARYLQGQRAYQSKKGVPLLEQLAAQGGRMRAGSGGFEAASPVTPLSLGTQGNALERAIGITKSGPRANQAFTAFDLGDGRRSHVYYDPHGNRKVFTFRPK